MIRAPNAQSLPSTFKKLRKTGNFSQLCINSNSHIRVQNLYYFYLLKDYNLTELATKFKFKIVSVQLASIEHLLNLRHCLRCCDIHKDKNTSMCLSEIAVFRMSVLKVIIRLYSLCSTFLPDLILQNIISSFSELPKNSEINIFISWDPSRCY